MDPVDNPFAPGAGSQPPDLAGREEVINQSLIGLKRIKKCRHERSLILLGLRGTGKTVLLNKFEEIAIENDLLTSFIEAPEDESFPQVIYPKIHQILRKLSMLESAKAKVHSGLKALKAFSKSFKVEIGDASISLDPDSGVADSGILEFDLTDLFLKVGEAAKAANLAWALFIDEVQYLKEAELASLISAIHRVNQKSLPIIFYGAGLPQIAALSGDAKSYAERLFHFPRIGPLDRVSAMKAIKQPLENENVAITDDALQEVYLNTEGYPYFLQEWGYQCWNEAQQSPIDIKIVKKAGAKALNRLDQGFFSVRYDRLTPKEKDYIHAMANLGKGPYKSLDVAAQLKESQKKLGPRRSQIIKKGMVYSPEFGNLDFTVPRFDDFLRRTTLTLGNQ
jgi:AAA+ ATPase superfamily predicted ATPase